MFDFLQKLAGQFEYAVAGMLGSIAAIRFGLDRRTASAILLFVFTGATCAHYLTPIVSNYLSIEAQGGISFLLGAFGGSFISAMIKTIQSADFWSLVKSRFGGVKESE